MAEEPAERPATVLGEERVILHLDVDSFYCAVEVRDAPALRGRPIAVEQFNSGNVTHSSLLIVRYSSSNSIAVTLLIVRYS